MQYLLALDQGTSSSRSILFDRQGQIIHSAQIEFTQHYPQAAWVEHDPMEIWHSQKQTIEQVLRESNINVKDIAALGITNQRETCIVWNRQTGEPIYPAIVWQDRRTAEFCQTLREQGHTDFIRQTTGLVIDPYFSASKLRWILNHVPNARQQAERGELAFGTVDTWLAYQLSGKQLHVSDVSNASRTMLWNIHRNTWDADLLALFDIPTSLLPTVHPSSYDYGECTLFGHAIPIASMAGDQQAALFGQACFEPGMAKNTYGTGCFMLAHTGTDCPPSTHGLISTAAAQLNNTPQYAIEGSVFIGGAVVQWLRDKLHIIQHSSDIEALAASVPDSDGVIFVPAFAGLGAPYWQADAKAAIFGLHRGSTDAHIARAAVEAIAFQSAELLFAMQNDYQHPIHELRVDGGAARNNALLQFQADLLGIPIVRPRITETTALGAAYLAGLSRGIFASPQECQALWQEERRFLPQCSREHAQTRLAAWKKAIQNLRTV
ncbi:MAG: glycerol kinase GlpK [Burkholderiaceae bacterium]|nr:MAG: glycerol kinase GlpK [Burkholderiaceae bacterium]